MKLLSRLLWLNLLLCAGCTSPAAKLDDYYREQYAALTGEAVSLVSDACVLRDEIGDEYFLKAPSEAAARSAAAAAAAHLRARRVRVNDIVVPFACGVPVPAESLLSRVADNVDSGISNARPPYALGEPLKSNRALAEAYQMLIIKAVSAKPTAETKLDQPSRTLQVSDAQLQLLRDAFKVNKLWVIHGGGVKASALKSVGSTVTRSGSILGLTAPADGYGFDAALIDLQFRRVLWKKRIAVPGGDPSDMEVYTQEWATALFDPLLPQYGSLPLAVVTPAAATTTVPSAAPRAPAVAPVARPVPAPQPAPVSNEPHLDRIAPQVSAAPAVAPKAVTVAGQGAVTLSAQLLRNRPVMNSPASAQVPAGTPVEVLSAINNEGGAWSFVRAYSGQGWVPTRSIGASPQTTP